MTETHTKSSAGAAQPVAWRVMNDFGRWYITQDKALADTYRDTEKKDVQPLYLAAQQPAAPVETKHSPDECGRECQYYDYFEMLWRWFADESRNGAEDMRANVANGGLSADDFKQMLDDHEANLIPAQPQEAWQPIETAKRKDGTRIQAWDGKKQFICHFRGEHHEPHQDKPGWFEQHIRMHPTHWKPLGPSPLSRPQSNTGEAS